MTLRRRGSMMLRCVWRIYLIYDVIDAFVY